MRPNDFFAVVFAFAVLLFPVLLVSPADAAGLVYLDGDKDVAAARTDGSGARKLVDDNLRKGAISVDETGRIAYFSDEDGSDPYHQLIDKEGKRLVGPFLFGDIGFCGYVSPFRSAFSPDGTWLAVTYFHGNACNSATFTLTTRLVDADGPTANGSIYGSFTDLKEPRFLPQAPPLLSGIIGNVINVWQSPSSPVMSPWIGLDDPAWDIDSFDFDPTRNRMIMEQSQAGIGSEQRDFLLLDFEAPGSPDLSPVCIRDGFVTASEQPARPRYSPDGSKIAWTGPGGIYVSPVPSDNGGTCTLEPKLVIPGGTQVEWAPFDLSSAPGGGSDAPKLVIAGAKGTSRAGFRKGMTVRVKVPSAGLVRVTASVAKGVANRLKLARSPRRPVIVATGSRRAGGAGLVNVKLKPATKAKAAWRRMNGVRVTLKAAHGNLGATRTVKLSR